MTKPRLGWQIFLPLVGFGLILGAYSAYWFIARAELSKGIDSWIEAERARGMTVEFSEKRLGGYPFRFALFVDEPVYGDSRNDQRWQGEQLQLIMQPWNWQHVIARAPGENCIFNGELEGWAHLGPKSAGSVSWSDTGIERVSLAVDEARFDVAGEIGGALDRFEFHLRPYPGEPDTLQLETHWQALKLNDTLPGADTLGPRFGPSILRAEATRAFSALATVPDLSDLPAAILARGGEITLAQAMVDWGPLDAGARGKLARDREAGLTGSIGLRLDNADMLRAALQRAGELDSDTETAIAALDAASADGRFLELSVRDDGLYLLGNKVVAIDVNGALE
ncbi:MAG: DUF2125 domain-containing protein [Pseudomonadota bacterium]